MHCTWPLLQLGSHRGVGSGLRHGEGTSLRDGQGEVERGEYILKAADCCWMEGGVSR
jgi:hypothetical protein